MSKLIGQIEISTNFRYSKELCVKIYNISKNIYSLFYKNTVYLIQIKNHCLILKASYKFSSYVLHVVIFESQMYVVTSEGIVLESLSDKIDFGCIEETTDYDTFIEKCNYEKETYKFLKNVNYKQDSIESIILTSNEVIICLKDTINNAWMIKVLQKEELGCEKILCIVQCDKYYPYDENIEDQQWLDPFEKKTFPMQHRPILLNIEKNENNFINGISCLMHKSLFISLFGGLASLANEKIILLGLPDGRVMWKNFCLIPNETQPYLLCKLNQPILGLFCTKLHSDEDDISSYSEDSLVILGSEGKFIVYTMNGKSSCKSEHIMLYGYLEASLYSCLMWKNIFIYITISGQLFCTKLQLFENTLNMNSSVLSVNDVIAINFIEENNNIRLLCLTSIGNLYVTSFNQVIEEYYSTDQIQNTLKSITDCSNQILHQQLIFKKQQQALSQLAIAANLLFYKQTLDDIKYTVEEINDQKLTYLLRIDFSSVKKLDLIFEYWHFTIFIHINNKSICKVIPIGKCFHSCFILNFQTSSTLLYPVKIECILQLDFSSIKYLPLTIKKLSPIYITAKEEIMDLWYFLTNEKCEDSPECSSLDNECDNEELSKKTNFKSFLSQKSMKFINLRPVKTTILMSTHKIQQKNKSSEDEINLEDILKYFLEKNSNPRLQINNNCLQCYYFGLKVDITFCKKNEYLQTNIATHHLWHLCKFRRSIIYKLKSILNMKKEMPTETISLSKTCLVEAKVLLGSRRLIFPIS